MLKIRLIETGKHKIEVIKLIRLFTRLGLKESKELMENIPSVLISNRDDISLEQIKKNFEAIGAVVEEITEEKNPVAGAAGIDDSQLLIEPESPNRMLKDFDEKQLSNLPSNQKLDLKSAIVFAIIAALIKSFISIYLGYITVYMVFIAAIGTAFFLRLKNPIANKSLGFAAASITLLYFISSIISDWVLLFVLYQYMISLNIFEIFVSFFTSLNIFVLLAALLAFVLASNQNIFKNLHRKDLQIEENSKEIVENKQIIDHKVKKKF